MSARDDEIRRVAAELDIHVAEVEAGVAVLKALLADEVPGEEEMKSSVSSSARSPVNHAGSAAVGLFVPKPSTDADCQRRSMPGLGQTVHGCPRRPPLAVAIVTHLVTQSFCVVDGLFA